MMDRDQHGYFFIPSPGELSVASARIIGLTTRRYWYPDAACRNQWAGRSRSAEALIELSVAGRPACIRTTLEDSRATLKLQIDGLAARYPKGKKVWPVTAYLDRWEEGGNSPYGLLESGWKVVFCSTHRNFVTREKPQIIGWLAEFRPTDRSIFGDERWVARHRITAASAGGPLNAAEVGDWHIAQRRNARALEVGGAYHAEANEPNCGTQVRFVADRRGHPRNP